jgi:iron complex transport system substrate-binding protein
VLDAIRKAGVNVVIAPETRTAADARQRITFLGSAFGAAARAEQLTASLDSELGAANAIAKPAAAPRVVFVMARGGAPMVAGTKTAAASMIDIAGGVNAISEYEGYKPLSPEAGAMLQPDFVLTTTRVVEEAGGRDAFSRLAGIAGLLGDNAKLVVMDDLLLLGFGPRLGKALAELRTEFTKTS